MLSYISLATFVAALPAVSAAGQAIVQNNCPSTVNLWSVDSISGDGPKHSIAPGETYRESFRSLSSGGVSIKMTHKDGLYYVAETGTPNIAQFEYTLAGNIWYDISLINGNPFWFRGMKIIPSDSSCPSKFCPAGEKVCTDAYNTPDQNTATAACSADSDITFYLCDGTSTKRDALPESSVALNETREAGPEPAPEVAVEIEDIHANMRKRAAHRHHFHRHSADTE